MLVKTAILGFFIASTPIYLATSEQASPEPQGKHQREAAQARRAAEKLQRAQAKELDRLSTELDAAERRVEELETQLEEALDMLEQSSQRRRRNCTPSRSLLTQFQWMRRNGHVERAQNTIARFVKEIGDDNRRLNRCAWELMTDAETAGKFDDAALALAERMQERPNQLSHRLLDTIALAKFLNGRVDEAIDLQRLAIERGGKDDDYRRRLRTYEAAKKVAVARPGLVAGQ